MMNVIPEYLDWAKPDTEYVDRWEYRRFKEFPPGDSSKETIDAFMRDAKEAEKEIEQDLISEGYDEKTAKSMSCQWPIKDDAPPEIVRNFIEYNYAIQEAIKQGVDI